MEPTWRWFGPNDPITLAEIRQTGATGIVTALHEIPAGEVWPIDAIERRRQMIEDAGLRWSVVESVPVPEAVKQGRPDADRLIDAFAQTLRHLGACGIDTVCYNFMPVLDWTRTDLFAPLPGGGTALCFEQAALAAFDLFILERPGAERDYNDTDKDTAERYFSALDWPGRRCLTETIIAGLPGAAAHYTLAEFRQALAAYDGIDRAGLRAHLACFLAAVVPAAEAVGVRLAIHPDDPPRPLFGLPRVVCGVADAQWLLDAAPSPANGLTLCTGSYGVEPANDLVAMARDFGPRIYFAHLRSTRREPGDPRSFHEAGHLDGDVDIVGVIAALLAEEDRRGPAGPGLPMRADHGHHLLDDTRRDTRPGYPLYGRMKGLAELRGIERALGSSSRSATYRTVAPKI